MSLGERLQARADRAYRIYLVLSRREEYVEAADKLARHVFGPAELMAHTEAAKMWGRHIALQEAAQLVLDKEEVPR